MTNPSDHRPDPEALLARIKEEERLQSRGKLKIFFGAAPGVGKTHSMLEEAIEKIAEGVDLVAGIVETHGRKEVESMVARIEQISRRSLEYHGRTLYEFDLDKALSRKPSIILVDELAHTNLPGSRHSKRWQDIEELLNRGVDVYTTLNVQHVESLNDIISQITGITVHETIPDVVLEEAHSIELIDLPPDDLLRRLQEGKVYAPEQAKLASKNFFNKGNLFALRELALRVMSERANAQVVSYREAQAIYKAWPTTERVLVCVTPNANSSKLIRVARRIAARLQAKWMVVFVHTPRRGKLSSIEEHSLHNNFQLAERLGGETFTLNGPDIVGEILHFARDCNVTKIIVGKESRSRLKAFFLGSIVDELIRRSGDADIYIVQNGYEKNPRLLPIIRYETSSRWPSYVIAIGIISVCTLLALPFGHYFEPSIINMIYLMGITIVAMRGQRGPAVIASLLSVLLFDFLFVPPKYTLIIHDTQYFVDLIVMLLMALIISHLTIMTKRQAQLARLRERRTAAMYALSRKLASARGQEKILATATRHIAEVFDSHVAVLLPDKNGKFTIHANYGESFIFDEKEQSIVQWVYDLGQVAGLGTQTLPITKAIYLPLLGAKSILGVLRVKPVDANRLVISEQLHLLETFAHQTALVIEVDQLAGG